MTAPEPHEAREGPEPVQDELARQTAVLWREMPVRLVSATLAYGMCLIYLPPLLVAAVAAVDLALEVRTHQVLRDAGRKVLSRWQQRQALVLIFVVEACFALPPALLWHIEDAFAKALCVGIAMAALMHMATMRAIHLPHGIAGLLASLVVLLGSNLLYWTARAGWAELALTTLCALVAIGFSLATMVANHRLHRDNAARRWAALRADRAKGRFMARMSHELRTPLNGILGLAHAELRQSRDPEVRARLAVLVASAEGLATILDDSMDDAAVHDGRLPIRLRPTVPQTAVSMAAAMFRDRIEEAGLALVLDIGPDLDSPAMMDEHRLRQCLSNLLSNALRHGGSGTITVRARRIAPEKAAPMPEGDPVLAIIVRDTGAGMPAERRARLFDAARPDGAPPHSGLGLGITRDLARRMGGDLVLDPLDPDQPGTSFTLTLALPGLPVSDAPQAQPPSLVGLGVLVVDDLATNRLVARSCLRLLGIEAEEAGSGEDAVARLRQGPLDAVLLDLNMPGMDGTATLRALRSLPGGDRIAVIAMTADAMPGDRARCLAAGMDAYLAKPVTPKRLAEALHQGRAQRLGMPVPTADAGIVVAAPPEP